MTTRAVLASASGSAVSRLAAAGDVLAVLVDLGGGDAAAIRRRALAYGAAEVIVVDARDEFAAGFCLPAVQSNALLVDAALARSVLERHLVVVAEAHHAEPVFAAARPGRTLWSHAAEAPADPWCAPGDAFTYTEDPAVNREAPDEVVVTFDRGVPVAVDGETVSVREAVQMLNHRAGAHGIGRIDRMTDRRELHEAPGATVLVTAHRELERMTLERELARFKENVDRRWAELVQDGLWSSPLREPLDAFVRHTQEYVCGDIRLLLHGGTAVVTGRRGADLTRGRHLRPVGRRYRPLTGQEHPDHPNHRAS
ncbi:argininosuccinate synthase domain-containing protein [Amycolatopsis sp. NPDC004368]